MKKDARREQRPPEWLTEPCPPWCKTNYHSDGLNGEDRNHHGPTRKVKFLTMDQCMHFGEKLDDTTYWAAHAHLWLTQGLQEVAPRLVMESEVMHWGVVGKRPEVLPQLLEMTIPEARRLARIITQACDTAEAQ